MWITPEEVEVLSTKGEGLGYQNLLLWRFPINSILGVMIHDWTLQKSRFW